MLPRHFLPNSSPILRHYFPTLMNGTCSGENTRLEHLRNELEFRKRSTSSKRGSNKQVYPTLPSSDTLSSFCASTANSIGSLLSTSLA